MVNPQLDTVIMCDHECKVYDISNVTMIQYIVSANKYIAIISKD